MLKTLLLTDIVNSTALTEELGDARMREIWIEHDRIARELLPLHNGREADRTDGFLMLFDQPDEACNYAIVLHQEFEKLSRKSELQFQARIGIHTGDIILIEHTEEQRAAGVKPIEVEGLAKPVAARIMSLAQGGQTLLSRDAWAAQESAQFKSVSHGHWRMKGVADPLELFEVGTESTTFQPPSDSSKVYRVNLIDEVWVPTRETQHNLGVERDRFIGRKKDLSQLAELVNSSDSGLISILGPGGTGKTRLSKMFGRMWLGDYPGGVWFCDLSEARTDVGITAALASVLDVPLTKGTPVEQLANAIRGRGECLIILDNFEQVADQASETLGKWLTDAPEAKFLVTSRVLLQLPGEKTFELRPLILNEDAIELFKTRAQDRRSEFRLTAENTEDVQAIVKALDGMPLAIELAAARLSVLQPRQIRERLGERFKLLTGKKGVARRQQTLKSTIDWSWELLTDYERSALAQCSVFEGGFTLEAAEAVINLEDFPEAPMTMDVIQNLVDKSLLKAGVRSYDSSIPEVGMYVSIREYCSEKLGTESSFPDAGPAAERACHERYIAHLAQYGKDEWIEKLHSHGSRRKLEILNSEIDNLLKALDLALDFEDASQASLLLYGLWQQLKRRGPREIIKTRAERLLEIRPVIPEAQVRAYVALHQLAVAIVDSEVADHCFEQGSRVAKECGDLIGEATLHVSMAYIHENHFGGEYVNEHASRSLELSRQAGCFYLESMSLQLLAFGYGQQKLYSKALKTVKEGLLVAEKHGDTERMAALHDAMGSIERDQGNQEEARKHYHLALKLAREIGNRFFEVIITFNLGQSYYNYGEFGQAEKFYRQAGRGAAAVGDIRLEAGTLVGLAVLKNDQDLHEEAYSMADRSYQIFKKLGDSYFLAYAIASMGLAESLMGRHDSALNKYEESLDLMTQIGIPDAESQIRAAYGTSLAQKGMLQEAQQEFNRAEQLLKNINARLSLSLLYARWAKMATIISDTALAEEKLTAAIAFAEELQLDRRMATWREIEKVRSLLNSPAQPDPV